MFQYSLTTRGPRYTISPSTMVRIVAFASKPPDGGITTGPPVRYVGDIPGRVLAGTCDDVLEVPTGDEPKVHRHRDRPQRQCSEPTFDDLDAVAHRHRDPVAAAEATCLVTTSLSVTRVGGVPVIDASCWTLGYKPTRSASSARW